MTTVTDMTAAELDSLFTPDDILGINGRARQEAALSADKKWEDTLRRKYMYGFSESRVQDILYEANFMEFETIKIEEYVIKTCELIRSQGIT